MATLKQKRAIKIMAENGGNASAAMREAGYSEQTAVTPGKLTGAKGFKELLAVYLPDDKVLKAHKSLMNKKVYRDGAPTEEIDTNAVKSATDMAYKLKGSYAPVKQQTENLNLNLNVQADAEAIGLKDKFDDELFDKFGDDETTKN